MSEESRRKFEIAKQVSMGASNGSSATNIFWHEYGFEQGYKYRDSEVEALREIVLEWRKDCVFNAETNEYAAAEGWLAAIEQIDKALAAKEASNADI